MGEHTRLKEIPHSWFLLDEELDSQLCMCVLMCVLIGHGSRTWVRAWEKTLKRREIEVNGIHMIRQPKGLTGEEGTSWRRGANENKG